MVSYEQEADGRRGWEEVYLANATRSSENH
jgi:hypothetical protein